MRKVLPIALVVVCSLLGLVSSEAQADIRPLNTGFSYTREADPSVNKVVAKRMSAAGARLTLAPLGWSSVAPSSKPAQWNPRDSLDPNYDWEGTDSWVKQTVGQGLVPVLKIAWGPRWAMRCDPQKVGNQYSQADAPCNPKASMVADFAYAAASRYSGQIPGLPRVRFWQIFNEVNTPYFFKPQVDGKGRFVSAKIYRPVLNRAYEAIKSVNRSNLVLAAGSAPNGEAKLYPGPLEWTRELLCMKGRKNPRPLPGKCGGGVKFDIFDVHPYTSGGPTHHAYGADNVQLGDLPELKKLLRAADRAGRIKGRYSRTPLWVTEFSWDTNPPDPNGVPIRIHARWTSEALYRAWLAGVSNFFWFSLRDQGPGYFGWRYSYQSGLYFRGETIGQDRPKRSLRAFRFPFVAFPAKRGVRIWGRTPNSSGGKVVIQAHGTKGWRRVARFKVGPNGVFKRFLRIRYGRDRRGSMRAVYRNQVSVPFSMKPVKDFPVVPFG